jgi:hypothetical protein
VFRVILWIAVAISLPVAGAVAVVAVQSDGWSWATIISLSSLVLTFVGAALLLARPIDDADASDDKGEGAVRQSAIVYSLTSQAIDSVTILEHFAREFRSVERDDSAEPPDFARFQIRQIKAVARHLAYIGALDEARQIDALLRNTLTQSSRTDWLFWAAQDALSDGEDES